jgi:hypothetical protein
MQEPVLLSCGHNVNEDVYTRLSKQKEFVCPVPICKQRITEKGIPNIALKRFTAELISYMQRVSFDILFSSRMQATSDLFADNHEHQLRYMPNG